MDKDLEQKKDQLPARISGIGGVPAGLEEVDMKQDIILPRLLILQGLSQLVSDGKGKVGELADSLSSEIYGAELTFIPLFLFKTKLMFEVGEGLVMYSRNGLTITTAAPKYEEYIGKPCDEVPFNAWKGNEPPELSMVYNFVSLRDGRLSEFPLSVSLMKTSAKEAKKLISLVMVTGEDMFARKYKIVPVKTENDKGTFYTASIQLVGKTNDEEYGIASAWFKKLRAKPIDVDLKDQEENF